MQNLLQFQNLSQLLEAGPSSCHLHFMHIYIWCTHLTVPLLFKQCYNKNQGQHALALKIFTCLIILLMLMLLLGIVEMADYTSYC